jgi:hypothetical protein
MNCAKQLAMVLLAFTAGCRGRADPGLSDAESASSDAGSSDGGPTDSAATAEHSTSDDAETGSSAGGADASNDSESAAEDAGGFDADCFRDAQIVQGRCCATEADCDPGAPPPWLYCCNSMTHLCIYCGPM